jgi:hypothetical protein
MFTSTDTYLLTLFDRRIAFGGTGLAHAVGAPSQNDPFH